MHGIIKRLQTSPLTSWIWKEWVNLNAGRIILLPFWKSPNDRYTKDWVKYKFLVPGKGVEKDN